MMISRRNYAMLTAIMLVVLFMFQAAGVAKNRLNDAQTNEYAQENRTKLGADGAFSPEKKLRQMLQEDGGQIILFLGDTEKSTVWHTVYEWCTYSKRAVQPVSGALDCGQYLDRTELLLVDAKTIDLETDVAALHAYMQQGIDLVFCNLPDVKAVGDHTELEQLLGITGIYEPQVKLKGVQLFDGFLLGGAQTYLEENEDQAYRQDLDLTVPWYLTLTANTSYMVGLIDDLKMMDGELDNEYAPNLVWRVSGTAGDVFVVNGDFMEDVTGIGILEAMVAQLHEYELYPVVNAQNFSVVNYPSFAEENSDEIERRYSRELPSLYRDVIWQSISSVLERDRSKTTALLAPQYDYTDEKEPSAEAFTYYARLFREKRMELGLSMEQVSDVPLAEKIRKDLSFLNENLAGYEYRAVYLAAPDAQSLHVLRAADGLQSVTTVLADYDKQEPLLSYSHVDGLCVQRATNDAFSHTSSEDLRMRAVESALGYTSVILDMERVAYPQTDKDNWEWLYEQFSSNQLTYWQSYRVFEKTTLSESDVRVRRFLDLDYSHQRSGDQITLDIDHFDGAAYFVLRTHGETVQAVSGGTAARLEKDAYLIQADSGRIVLTLENGQHLEYD